MFASFLIHVVDFSRKYAVWVACIALTFCLALGAYTVRNISINTDINQLLSDDLEWRKREKELETAFPQKIDTMVVVIDGPDGYSTEKAASALAQKMNDAPSLFTEVSRLDSLPFFRKNGLLYLEMEKLEAALDQIAQAQPMFGALVSDPSLRGVMGTIDMMVQGVDAGAVDAAAIEKPLTEIGATLQAALNDQGRTLRWHNMLPEQDDPLAARELRKIIVAKPVLDYSSLQPGQTASSAVMDYADELELVPEKGITVRLTGSVPLSDEEFASVSKGAGLATAICGFLVFVLLFVALRSWKIVLPITLTLIAGLIASTAFATCAVGSLNLISVAFAVMFIGIAVDFGIQFGVRYRDEHSREPDHAQAMRNTARIIATPLAMAAAATALGFLAFTPTDYRGVSELGLIAGVGMIIAFILNLTLLPALMSLAKPPPEQEAFGFETLAPLNVFLIRNKRTLLPAIVLVSLAGIGGASHVRFDFDPLDLKDPKAVSVSTMFELLKDPDSNAYAAQILADTNKDAQNLQRKLSMLPSVDRVMTLESFVPENQEEKLSQIEATALILDPTFALPALPKASEADNREALKKTAAALRKTESLTQAARTVADVLESLAVDASPETLARAQSGLIDPMIEKMEDVRLLLQAEFVTTNDIPSDLARDWVTPEGRHLVEIYPKRGDDNNPRDPERLAAFIDSIQAIAPDVAGAPVSIRESGKTIVSAFVQAGIYGFISIALLSLVVLRRVIDVLIMLAPLVVAGILTLATIAVFDMPLNFANIIALPLLFSLGVSYAVYFVFFARQGRKDFLNSSMARAVLFSAATVLVAFLALLFSSHPGTQSMGELLTIALYYCLLCTFLLLPVLYVHEKKDSLH